MHFKLNSNSLIFFEARQVSSAIRTTAAVKAEMARLSAVVAGLEQRAGAGCFAEWCAQGRQLDLPQAVQLAVELVERHSS